MLEVIHDPSLQKIPGIGHGFFTRKGGVSQGRYKTLNCAFASQDDPESVRENRRRVMAYFDYSLEALTTVRNVHGNQVMSVEDSGWSEEQKPEADAMVTQQKNIVLASDSADCPIVLFADEQAGVIGLAHAGWRSAVSGILEATLKKMVSLGAKHQNISAAISPCIHQESYEVSLDFYQQFLEHGAQNEQFFKPSVREQYFMFALPEYVQSRLKACQLKSISMEAALNTYADEQRFFSCRRATHRGEPDFGGHFSCIFIK